MSAHRQHYPDANKQRPFDWQDSVVMAAASIVGGIWLCWIVEGLLS